MINLIIITGLSIFGYILYHMDQKRITDPYYKQKVQKIRNQIKFKEKEKLKHRLLIFPASNNMKHIKNFVVQEVNIYKLEFFFSEMYLLNMFFYRLKKLKNAWKMKIMTKQLSILQMV